MVDLGSTIKAISKLLRDFLVAEEYAYREGFLQGVDQKVKLMAIFLLIVLAVSTQNIFFLLLLFLFSVAMVGRVPILQKDIYTLRFNMKC